MTKKLKLVIVFVTTVTSMNVNAQKKTTPKATKPKTEVKTTPPGTETKAAKPTKQETMDWIAGKMKENIQNSEEIKFVSYNEGVFVYRNNYGSSFDDYSIDLNKVTGISSEYSKEFYVSGYKLIYLQHHYDKPGKGDFHSNLHVSGPKHNGYLGSFYFTPDQALVERLRKAFTTLIEYNSTKKGEGESF
jgi:hypothetical protein